MFACQNQQQPDHALGVLTVLNIIKHVHLLLVPRCIGIAAPVGTYETIQIAIETNRQRVRPAHLQHLPQLDYQQLTGLVNIILIYGNPHARHHLQNTKIVHSLVLSMHYYYVGRCIQLELDGDGTLTGSPCQIRVDVQAVTHGFKFSRQAPRNLVV